VVEEAAEVTTTECCEAEQMNISPARLALLFFALGFLGLTGCGSVSARTQPYVGVPTYRSTDPKAVEILAAEPTRPKERLGEIVVDISGEPSKHSIEEAIRIRAAKLGADGAFVVYDKTHIFPVVFTDWWVADVREEHRRSIVAVAFKYKS
jgi:hypothetical protein